MQFFIVSLTIFKEQSDQLYYWLNCHSKCLYIFFHFFTEPMNVFLFCFGLYSRKPSNKLNICAGWMSGTVAWLTGYCQIIGAVCVFCFFSEGVLWCLAPGPFTVAPLGPLCFGVGPSWIRPALHVLQMLDRICCVPWAIPDSRIARGTQQIWSVECQGQIWPWHSTDWAVSVECQGSAVLMTGWGFVCLLCSTLCTNLRAENHQTLWQSWSLFLLGIEMCLWWSQVGSSPHASRSSACDQLSLSSHICK